jgi:hypothetical protein
MLCFAPEFCVRFWLPRFKLAVQVRGPVLRFVICSFCLFCQALLTLHPTPNPEVCPLSVVLDCLFNIFSIFAYSQLTSIYIYTHHHQISAPLQPFPRYPNFVSIAVLPLQTPIERTKRINRFSFLCCILKVFYIPSLHFLLLKTVPCSIFYEILSLSP